MVLSGYAVVSPAYRRLFDRLLELRTALRESRRPEAPVKVAGQSFALKAIGTEQTIHVANADLRLSLSEFSSTGMPNLSLAPSASLLWRLGSEETLHLLLNFVRRLLGSDLVVLKPRRVDMAVDVEGFEYPLAQDPRWVSRLRWQAAYLVGNTPTGTQFGKGKLVVRIYDKSFEILRSRKPWMNEIWASNGANLSGSVWRVEVQARREHLRGFGVDQMTSPTDLLGRVDAMWQSAVTRSLSLHDSRRHTRTDKDPIHPAWEVLRQVRFFGDSLDRAPVPVHPVSVDHHVRAVRGHLASIGAALDLEDEDACRRSAMRMLDRLDEHEPGEFQRRLNARRARVARVDPLVPGGHDS